MSKIVEPEYLYAVVDDDWDAIPTIERVAILKRGPKTLKVEAGRASGYRRQLNWRPGLCLTGAAAVTAWRSRLGKRSADLREELAHVEKLLNGPSPRANW